MIVINVFKKREFEMHQTQTQNPQIAFFFGIPQTQTPQVFLKEQFENRSLFDNFLTARDVASRKTLANQ